MASTQATLPGQTVIGRSQLQRSFTVPTKLQTTLPKDNPVDSAAADSIETLFVHPVSKVVSFTTSSNPTSSSHRPPDKDATGTLPWRSPTERTLAAGTLQIYRLPSSVSFLWSGSLLHAILPRSQCWCVDGVSTFVLRVLPSQYYRIELPGATEEDLALAEELKSTLRKVLHYERTPCPFARSFTVDLPSTPPPPSRRTSSYSTEPVKKWKLDGIWRPEDDENWVPNMGGVAVGSGATDSGSPTRRVPSAVPQRMQEVQRMQDVQEVEDDGLDDDFDTPKPSRPTQLSTIRRVTAPPKLTLIASPPSKMQQALVDRLAAYSLAEEQRHGKDSPADPVESSTSDCPPEAVFQAPQAVAASEDMSADLRAAQAQDLVENKTPPATMSVEIDKKLEHDSSERDHWAWSTNSTPSLGSDSEQAWPDLDGISARLQVRKTRSRESQKALANGIMRKTYGVFIRPPAHLVSIMLRIAATIKNGAYHFTIRSPPGSPQKVPGSYIIDNDEDDYDDYGFATQRRASTQQSPVL